MLRYLAHPYALLGIVLALAVGLFGANLAQAWAARALGDPGPVRQGFGAVQPRRQLDVLGVVAAALAYHAWSFAAAVPMQARFRKQRLRVALATAAGPLVVYLELVVACVLFAAARSEHLVDITGAAAATAAGLVIVSLLPFPPLPLGRIIFLYVPLSPGWQKARYQLSETQGGSLLALAVILLPTLFQSLPDVVGELALPLLRNTLRLVGG